MTRTCQPASATLGPVPIRVGLQIGLVHGSCVDQTNLLPKDNSQISGNHPIRSGMFLHSVQVLLELAKSSLSLEQRLKLTRVNARKVA